ncbi:MAG: transglutaminase family protein [Verrucomicrobiales bacterium]
MSIVRYHIRHLTTYRYSGRIDLCHSLAHLAPREDEGQETTAHRVNVSPAPDFRAERLDYFGNRTNYFAIQGSHASLEVLSTLTIEKPGTAAALPSAGLSWDASSTTGKLKDDSGIHLVNYVLPTHACPRLPEVEAFLRPSLCEGRDVMELAKELMARIHSEFDYVPGATDTSTPLGRVMEQKQGVCQDFAHVMISALRSVKIPARYVSGYIETLPPPGKEKLQGADASHAWVEVHAPATGWVPFDPTNDTIPGNRHIKVCHGRDYFDVQPLKGIFLGTGKQALDVEVDVKPF